MLLTYIFRFCVPVSAHTGMPAGHSMSISYAV